MSTSLRYTLAALLAVSLLALSLPAAASTGLQDHTAAAVAAASGDLTISYGPSSGPVGTTFTITGTGWAPGDTVTSTLPYGSPGWFTGYQTPTVDANGGFSYQETVGTGPSGPTPVGAYTITYVENYDGSSLSATQTFTVTPTSTLPDLLTDETYLPACFLSMGALAVALVAATEETGAILAWEGALALLDATGKLGDFLNQLQTNQYWAAALINAGIIDPLNECLTSVQVLLNDTSGQAGVAVAQWMEKNLHV